MHPLYSYDAGVDPEMFQGGGGATLIIFYPKGGGVLQPSKCRTTLAIKGGGVATPIHRQCDERKVGVHEYWLIVQIIGLVILRLNYQIISVHNILVKQTKHNKNIEDSLLEK